MSQASRVVVAGLVAAVSLGAATGTAYARRYIAWSSQDLPPAVERELDRVPGVRAQPVRLGLDWLSLTRTRSGALIERAPAGYKFPIEIGVVRPRAYAKWVSADHADTVRALRRDGALLSATEASLRRIEVGGRLRFGKRRLTVAGIIPDRDAEGYEMLIRPPVPPGWSGTRRTYLIEAQPDVRRRAVRRAIVRGAGKARVFRLRAGSETEFLRYADMLRPQLVLKHQFGEFAAAPGGGTSLRLDPDWRASHIRTDSVPLLGRVTCHRRLFPQLRRAMRTLRDSGAGGAVRSYEGCYNARFTTSAPGIRISRHTYGLAVDINAASNPYGARPNQPRALVRTMRRSGFLWGGSWPIPDAMHFEWGRFP